MSKVKWLLHVGVYTSSLATTLLICFPLPLYCCCFHPLYCYTLRILFSKMCDFIILNLCFLKWSLVIQCQEHLHLKIYNYHHSMKLYRGNKVTTSSLATTLLICFPLPLYCCCFHPLYCYTLRILFSKMCDFIILNLCFLKWSLVIQCQEHLHLKIYNHHYSMKLYRETQFTAVCIVTSAQHE